MKMRIFSVIVVFTIALTMLTGCGSGTTAKSDAANTPAVTTPTVVNTQPTESNGATGDIIKDKSSDAGEGIGKVVPPTNEEISYILSLKTQSWLDLNEAKQDETISLIVRWWESVDGYVDPDLDALKQDLNHQMETYSRNNTNMGLFETSCDIRSIDPSKYLKDKK